MTGVTLTFGIGLLLAVLLSGLSARSPLSTSTVLLGVGVVAGPLGLDVVVVPVHVVETIAEVALFTVLFTDGQHAPRRVLLGRWRPSAQALLVGMPMTFGIVALLAHGLTDLSWGPCLVLGAVLAPTDPVFASALVGRDSVPSGVRDVLNIESGLNDGLSLPVVLSIVGAIGGHPEGWSTSPWVLLGELLLGFVIGVGLPLLVHALLRLPGVGAVHHLRPLGPLSVAIVLFGVCDLVHANQFIAAFVAGSVTATARPSASDEFRRTGELASELAKGAALLAFVSLLDGAALRDVGVSGWILAVGVIVLSRPLPMMLALAGSSLATKERAAVAWFGPKGFSSVVYAAIVATSGFDGATMVLDLTALVVFVSAVAHSSTDVTVARWWDVAPPKMAEGHDV